MPKLKEPFILGFSDSVHDRSVCIFKGNQPLIGIEEERLTRVKHGLSFYGESRHNPSAFANMNLENSSAEDNTRRLTPAIDYCLTALGLNISDMDLVIGNSLHVGFPFRDRAIYINHHLAHASSAFFSSGFQDAAILIADGYGDITEAQTYETVVLGKGADNQIHFFNTVCGKVTNYYDMQNSIGVFYRIGTLLSGFGILDEGKAMGLSSYGTPRFYELIRRHIVFNKDSVLINNKAIWDVLSIKVRNIDNFNDRADVASTFQILLQEIILHYADILYEKSGSKNLCIAGGVGLNCVSNASLLKKSKFEQVFIFPAAGDNGISFGSGYYAAHQIFQLPRTQQLKHAYFGRIYSGDEIEDCLLNTPGNFKFKRQDLDLQATEAARLLSENNIIMWFQEGSELGPRALGHRSILANPGHIANKDYINSNVKFRELFRPLAPMILEEFASTYFDCSALSPFMLFSPPVREITTKVAPAIVHCDNSARLQTLSLEANPLLHKVITAFYQITGIPILLNTSFNGKDEPIVETPQQGLNAFLKSPVEYLFMDNYKITKHSKNE